MKKVFKKVDGEIVDVVQHTLDILNKFPSVAIHIGTDSQTFGDKTIYCTSIAYRYGNRGVHYIISKSKFPRINDLWTRLWKEAELSIETAEWLTQSVSVKVDIDMDYNSDETKMSHKLVSAASGWAASLGYNVNIKPDNVIAVYAADYSCRYG